MMDADKYCGGCGKDAAECGCKPAAASNGYAPWTPPFRYEPLGPAIFDHFGHKILDLRGWGFLTGLGGGAMHFEEQVAAEIQNKLGKRLAALMTADAAGRMSVPIDHRNGKPLVTSAMKAECIGEFSFERECGDEDGNEAYEKITVPWTTCKEIYKAMAVEAAKA